MKLRLTVVYEVDGHEIWLERIFENLEPPAYLRVGDSIELSYSDNAASFNVLAFDWYMPENEIAIHLNPCVKPKDHDEFWHDVRAFLADNWEVCEGNTAYTTLNALRKKGYADKITR